jgi:hypothetical protein
VPATAQQRAIAPAMHIVVLAWLYIIGTMSLTFGSVAGGAAFFVVAGVAPVALYAWLALRRHRARASVREEQVHDRDHADAGGDQR